jgi:hypothetical protein
MRGIGPGLALIALALAACAPDEAGRNQATAPAPGNIAADIATARPLVEPPAPGTPGGLPDDRTPISEARFAETSAQGAANVVQHYFALLEQRRYAEARRLWGDEGAASGMDAAAFAAGFARFSEYHAQIGAPGEIEGACGSLYVEVPVVAYGRLRSGAEYHARGTIGLRRVNDVPGSTPAQRRWHIAGSDLEATPGR